jgi:hypothetical protein
LKEATPFHSDTCHVIQREGLIKVGNSIPFHPDTPSMYKGKVDDSFKELIKVGKAAVLSNPDTCQYKAKGS